MARHMIISCKQVSLADINILLNSARPGGPRKWGIDFLLHSLFQLLFDLRCLLYLFKFMFNPSHLRFQLTRSLASHNVVFPRTKKRPRTRGSMALCTYSNIRPRHPPNGADLFRYGRECKRMHLVTGPCSILSLLTLTRNQ